MKQEINEPKKLEQEILFSYQNGRFSEMERGDAIHDSKNPSSSFFLKIRLPADYNQMDLGKLLLPLEDSQLVLLSQIISGSKKEVTEEAMFAFLREPAIIRGYVTNDIDISFQRDKEYEKAFFSASESLSFVDRIKKKLGIECEDFVLLLDRIYDNGINHRFLLKEEFENILMDIDKGKLQVEKSDDRTYLKYQGDGKDSIFEIEAGKFKVVGEEKADIEEKLNEILVHLNAISDKIDGIQAKFRLKTEAEAVKDEKSQQTQGTEELGQFDVDAVLTRSKELSAKSDDLQTKATQYLNDGLSPDSSEVRSLLKECENIRLEIDTIKGSIHAEIEKLKLQHAKMQVVVINDDGIYKEVAREVNKEKFLSVTDFENLLKSPEIVDKYPGKQLMVIEVDREKYSAIKGLLPDHIRERSTLLTAEGDIKYSQAITPSERIEEKIKLSKEHKQIQELAARENRNVWDGIWDMFKMVVLMFKGELKESLEVIQKEEPPVEKMQVVVLEKEDGSILEVKVERNSNLFLQNYELEPFAKEISAKAGSYYLLELPVKDYPNVNNFLEKGIMTAEGKQKFQQAKVEFFKKQTGKTEVEKATAIVTEKVEKKPVRSENPKTEKKEQGAKKSNSNMEVEKNRNDRSAKRKKKR